MAFPRKFASGEIDLLCLDEPVVKSFEPCGPPIAFDNSPARRRRYHSVQLAIVTGVFACGGFLCSLFFVDGGDEFPQPHHWLRESYSSPVMMLPPSVPQTRAVPQIAPAKLAHATKTAELQHCRISSRKVVSIPTHSENATASSRLAMDMKTKWTDFSENLRDRVAPLNSARLRVLDFGRRLRECHFESGRLSIPDDADKKTNDAG